jgi:hypothetical protein
VAGPLCNLQRCAHIVFWIWLHLLHFNVANQIIDPQEDGKNKSSRPIPAGLISLEDAVMLRWALIPICLVTSACYSSQVFGLSFVLTLFIIFYNELKAHEHWISKNFITAVGYACFEIGSTLIAGLLPSILSLNDLLIYCPSRQRYVTVRTHSDFSNLPEPCSVHEHIACSGFQRRRGGPPYRQANVAHSIPQCSADVYAVGPSSVVHLPVSCLGSEHTLHACIHRICNDGGAPIHVLQDITGSANVLQTV